MVDRIPKDIPKWIGVGHVDGGIPGVGHVWIGVGG